MFVPGAFFLKMPRSFRQKMKNKLKWCCFRLKRNENATRACLVPKMKTEVQSCVNPFHLRLGFFVKMGNDAPMIARKSLASDESRETFESNEFKVDSLKLICWSVVQSIKSTARSETLTPLQVVIPQQVPSIHCFWSSSCGFPDISHAGWYAAYILQLRTKVVIKLSVLYSKLHCVRIKRGPPK